MTRRKPLSDLERPRRALGLLIRTVLVCPVCRAGDQRIVAYRKRNARMECPTCGLRYSVDIIRLYVAVVSEPERIIDADPGTWAALAAITGIAEGTEDHGREAVQQLLRDKGVVAVEGHLRAIGVWDAFEASIATTEEGD